MADATPSEIVLCTGNEHKASEFAQLLAPITVTPLPRDAVLPEETGDTFVANARIKAVGGRAFTPPNVCLMADDSGLCVDALAGRPGVYSARYAGPRAADSANIDLLLTELANADARSRDERAAHFVCVLVTLAPDGTEHVVEGRVSGHIAPEPRGDNGFGYDPVFIPEGYEHTFGELSPAVKAQLSHRARAAAQLRELLGLAGPKK